MPRRRWITMVFLVVVLALAGSSAASAGLNWTAGLYMWATGLDGRSTVRGQEADIDLSFTDIAEDLEMAAMVHLEGSSDEPGWGFFLDYLWVDLAKGLDRPLKELEMQLSFFEGAVTYGLDENLQFFLGARRSELDTKLSFDFMPPGPGILPLPDSVSGDASWTDLMVGARIHTTVGDKWGFRARGDMAGFGIGGSSKFTWNLVVSGQRYFGEHWSMLLGYRILSIDYADEDTGMALDANMRGPLLAGAYSF